MRKEVAEDIRTVLGSSNPDEAREHLELVVRKYEKTAPRLSRWMEENLPEGFAVYRLAKSERRHMGTTNMLERYHRELKRRLRVTGPLPNEASLLRLATARLMEISDRWETGRKYMTVKEISSGS